MIQRKTLVKNVVNLRALYFTQCHISRVIVYNNLGKPIFALQVVIIIPTTFIYIT